jgi:hypothetical protein
MDDLTFVQLTGAYDGDEGMSDRQVAGTPVEHVKTHCPALIATLVAIAREAQDNAKSVTERAQSEHR